MDEGNMLTEESGLSEDDPMRSFLPASFGKQAKTANVDEQIRRTKRTGAAVTDLERLEEGANVHLNAVGIPGQIQEPVGKNPNSDDEDEDGEGDDDDDDEDEDEFPVSHELVLKTHERAITTASLDPSGSRLVTGSTDCTLKFHDFASMTPSTLRAFRSIDPTATKASANQETHPVNHVEFNSLSAGQILVVPATSQAKILSRDGEVLTEFVKGDMYLRDMNNTKGHISEIVTGTWNPTDRNICVTAGTDSTLRIWDVNNKRSQREVIVYKSRVAGAAGRSRMTAVAWGNPAQGGKNMLIGAALDGGLAMWSGDGPFTRPAAEIRDAHTRDTWTGGVDISADGRLVVTRGGDNLIKCAYIVLFAPLYSSQVLMRHPVWDTRKFKAPVTTVLHPSTSAQYPTSNICFSPNSTYIVTGSETGHLHILNPATLKPELVTPVTLGSPLITVLWHAKLNQIITGSANTEAHVLYNPTISFRGAVDVMSKAPKRRHIDDDPSLTTDLSQGLSGDGIVNPNGLLTGANQASISYAARHPTVGLTASGKSRDPRRPERPMVTPFAKSQPDERHIKENIPLSSMRDEDPREALLKYAEVAEKDPMFTNAWKLTQPKTIYAELSDEEDEGPDKKKTKR